MKTLRRGLLLSALMMAAQGAWAQGYPAKPVRVVIPFAPGGGTDVVARPVVLKLGEALGKPMLYDNRGGANGIIGADLVAKSPADGYTLLLASSGALVLNVGLYDKLPYDPVRDFAPITMLAVAPNVLVAHPSVPVKNVQEMMAYAKANPNKLNFALTGGGAASLATELFRSMSGLPVESIPYKGAGPALTAVLAGEVQMMFANAGVFLPNIRAGKLRPLAVSSLQRLKVLPDVPTVNESGVKGFEGSSWFGIVAPTGTPAPIINQLYEETAKVLKSADIQDRYTAEGAIAVGNTPAQFGEQIKSEIVKWVKVIKDTGMKAE